MPGTHVDEKHWNMAKEQAKAEGFEKNYAYIQSIYQKMIKGASKDPRSAAAFEQLKKEHKK